jgi:hypothetical protein
VESKQPSENQKESAGPQKKQVANKHPVWNSKISTPSGLKVVDLFDNCNFEIWAPQHPTHFLPNGRCDVLDIVAHKDVRLSEVRILNIWIHITDLSYFAFWIILRLGTFGYGLKIHRLYKRPGNIY